MATAKTLAILAAAMSLAAPADVLASSRSGYSVAVPVSNQNMKECGGCDRVAAEVRRFDANRIFIGTGKYAGDRWSRADTMSRLKKNVQDFKARGFEVGVWNWTFWCVSTNGFTTMTGSDGWKSNGFACPLDPAFRQMAGDYLRDFAKCGPDLIMFDDDYRYGNLHGAALVCTCPLHMARIRKLLGEDVSPGELQKRAMTGGRNRYRDAWMSVNGAAFRDFAAEMRRRVDEVDPRIRLGLCAVMSLWDNDGVDAATIARILAGNTRPFLRLIGAPYWAVERLYYDGRLANVFEFVRMERSWCKGGDMEIFAEGDTYPRPRWRCPASYLELYDLAMRADGRLDGILKYGVDYSSAGEERGYALRHECNRALYAAVEAAFSGKQATGVRVYEEMNRLGDLEIEKEQEGTTKAFSVFGSPAAKLMSTCGIPTTWEGTGVVGVAFGPNVKYVPQAAFRQGLLIDAWAARILMAQGVDVGVRKWVSKRKVSREMDSGPEDSYSMDAFDAWEIETDPAARPLGYFVKGDGRFPSAYVYENAVGARFMVFAFDAYFNGGGMIRSNFRPRQIASGVKMLAGAPLPAFVDGGLDVYLMAKDAPDARAVGIWNTSSDALIAPEIRLDGAYATAEFINCTGRLEGAKAVLSNVPAWSFAGIVLKK